jgi:CheY-like chemotaxis protein
MAAGASLRDKAWTKRPPVALLVDRDADTRRMYAEYLKLWPCEIEEADDGRAALAKVISRRPDIIITETRLPGLSGLQLCDMLRAEPATSEIAIVFVTGDAYTADVRRAESAGADAVLIKPCLPETLLAEMRRLLGQSAERRELARESRRRELAHGETPEPDRVSPSARPRRRMTLSRAHLRGQTKAPPIPAPSLACPLCDQPLQYQRSHLGGVNARHPEQWDYYQCPKDCGTFQYRHRTRKLRRVG